MRHFDLFQPYEVLVKEMGVETWELTFEESYTLKNPFPVMPKVSVMRPKMLLAIWAINVPGFAWSDRSVWKISTGLKWIMFKDYLEQMGFPEPHQPFKLGGPEYNRELLARNWKPEGNAPGMKKPKKKGP